MEYYLNSISNPNSLKISKKDFIKIKKSYEICISALLFEESIDIVLSNYLEYESYLLNSSLKKGILSPRYMQISEVRIDVNRLVSNVLSIVYNYMQYGNTRINEIKGKDIFLKRKESLLEGDIFFNFMEELRNYSQHYGFPTQSITIDNFREKKQDKFLVRNFLIKPYVLLNSLMGDKNFVGYYKSASKNQQRKQSIIEIMKHYNSDEADLTLLIRHYIDCVWKLHKDIRKNVQSKVTVKKEEIESLIKKNTMDGKTKLGCEIEKRYKYKSTKITLAQRVLDEHSFLFKKYSFFELKNIHISNQY